MNSSDFKVTSKYNPKEILIDIFREFGLLGVVTYLGGVIMLYFFPRQNEFNLQVLYAISGLILLALATIILYIRIKAQREREKTLIEMGQNSCNRLAEQVAKGLPDKQVDTITQKIRQIHRDIFTAVFDHSIEK